MNDEQRHIERINRYLRDELDEAEERKYRRQLEDDPAFRRLHEEQEIVFKGIAGAARQEIRERITSIENEIAEQQPGTASEKPWLWYSGVAAAVALLLIAISFSRMYYVEWQNSQLYEQYFRPPADIETGTTRGGTAGTSAADAYNAGKMEEAKRQFEELVEEYGRPADRYHLALANMRLENYHAAEMLLRGLLASDNNFTAAARWHLALVLLQTDRAAECREQLKRLAASDSEYRDAAARLLSEL